MNPYAAYSQKEFYEKFASGLLEEPEEGDKAQQTFKKNAANPRRRLASDIITKDVTHSQNGEIVTRKSS